jgi:hypothetical protein
MFDGNLMLSILSLPEKFFAPVMTMNLFPPSCLRIVSATEGMRFMGPALGMVLAPKNQDDGRIWVNM